MTSKKFSLNDKDINKWLRNTVIFLAPALLVFLLQIQNGIPWQQALYAVYLWFLNSMIDILKKFIQETK